MSQRSPSVHRPAAAVAEALEPRRLLAAFISNRTLFVDGTSGNDSIELGVDGTVIGASVNGTTYRFTRSAVDRVLARGRGGNDQFYAYPEDGELAHIPTTLSGGDGDD